MNDGFRKILMGGLFGTIVAGSLGASSAFAEGPTGTLYLILPNSTTQRFEQFTRPGFEAAVKKLAPGMSLVVLNSDNNVQQQVSQVQSAIANDAKAIFLVSVDPQQAAGALALAAQAEIPVICYAHNCNGGPAYAQTSFSFEEVGKSQGETAAEWINQKYAETNKPVTLAKIYSDPKYPFYQAQKVGFDANLDPLVQAGKLKVVCEADSLDWLPSNSQQAMQQCLTQNANEVDAILSMNDDTAGGSYAAALAAGVDDITLLGGFDATLAGIQRVAAGIQLKDMLIDDRVQAEKSVELALLAIEGKPVPKEMIAEIFDNGTPEGVIQVNVPLLSATKDNLNDTIIAGGFYTKEQICSNSVASNSPFCTN